MAITYELDLSNNRFTGTSALYSDVFSLVGHIVLACWTFLFRQLQVHPVGCTRLGNLCSGLQSIADPSPGRSTQMLVDAQDQCPTTGAWPQR